MVGVHYWEARWQRGVKCAVLVGEVRGQSGDKVRTKASP